MSLRIAVIGAGPAGLALALHAARQLPRAEITVLDARPVARDVAADPRTLALSLGSVQWLQQLGAWPAATAEPILTVHVSQAPPSFGQAQVRITAAEQQVPMLGAVVAYGALLAPLQAAWLQAAATAPQRLHTRFGTAVTAVKPVPGGVEVDAGIVEGFDLAVVAEGGVFAEQARKAIARDYGQTAWVGTATLEGGTRGLAVERFTRQGPAALLPLPPAADGARRAALVWCVDAADDPVRGLDAAQRLAVLNTVFPREAGRLVALSPLKDFALGLNAERTLVDGRTVRIGNAAQTLHPVAGQGLNLGLRDAHQLVEALRFEHDVDAALRRVEWARAPDRWAMIAATDFLARSFTWRLPGASLLRGLGLAALERAGPAKALLARRMMYGSR
ncbi:FAD-dependent monooxygenase [Rubrivivax albus]|uniref:2-octaprenyl-6-methoxyphenyl hydroxylase n=1 Tax=Rubrivivax albus TaxID=2499835 RepID=A0A3S2X2B1_9BURK|nr:FAD-dependent monooxygenase [Rubrivivax albus]RVT52469.1 2-octaprenyl-6-methoxyphenyl hydroxylase [Rubrivivax albus]